MIALRPTDTEVRAAVDVSCEHDFEAYSQGCVTGRNCVACGEFEADDADSNDGIKIIAVPSEHLQACRDCSECYVHPSCSRDGRCPHCHTIFANLADARALLGACGDTTIDVALALIAAHDRRVAGVAE